MPLGPGILTLSNSLSERPLPVAVNVSVATITSAVVVQNPPSGTPSGALAKALNVPVTL